MTTTWTASDAARAHPELVCAERDALDQWLDFHRATLLTKCSGLTAEQLKIRAVPPSSLSLLGLVRHMTEVERWWFRMTAAAEPVTHRYCTDENEDGDFDDVDGADAAADLQTYRDELVACRSAVSGKQLDEVVAHPYHRGDSSRSRDLRWIYVHMIEEYARHNGHADLIRECIDGVTGD